MAQEKVMTLRVQPDMAAELEAVARVEGLSVAEEVRLAIADRIAERRADPDFQRLLSASLEENARLLQRLSAT